MHDLAHVTEANFDQHFNLNVKGPLFLVQKAVPHMPPGGRVIFVSTGLNTATGLTPAYLLYVATKGAVDQMVRALSKDLGSKGITVNAVAPGPTGTELFYKGKSEQLLEMMRKQSPFGRFGEPEEIAGVVAFLAGEDSRWVSGQVLRANGANMV
jgi:3-oxoacyl-[acyl-carrier protein] reductase